MATCLGEVEDKRLHVYGKWRRMATCLGKVEQKGYMSRGSGREWLHI